MDKCQRYPVKKQPLKALWRNSLLMGVVVMCCLGYQEMKNHLQQPQALLVLGGATERERFAAQFAREHPNLPIWVSSGSNPEFAEWVFFSGRY